MIKNSTLSALFLWIIILASYSFASDNYYLLKRGATAWDGGKLSEAIGYYQEYIDNHPATTNLYSEAYERRKQYYLRNLLIAYKKILLINQHTGDQASRSLWLDRLEALAAQGVMGAKNLYQAGWIMHKNERDDKAASIFEKIITEQCETYNPLHNKVLLRSCSKLIQIYEQKGESIKQMNLLRTIQKKFPTKDFDPRDLYQLANLYHVYGVNDEAIKLLNQCSDKISASLKTVRSSHQGGSCDTAVIC
ncbi:MAG: tetratricopeptide repeat protein, partial [Desulfobacterales bacterium]